MAHFKPIVDLKSWPQAVAALLLASWLSGCATSKPFNSDPSAAFCRAALVTPEAPGTHPAVACNLPTERLEIRRPPIRNLVFEGGGIKGTAFVGALNVLQDQGILDGVEHVAGTSAGAITALLLSLGYEVDDLHRIIDDGLDFSRLEDGSSIYGNGRRLVSRYGWYRGDYALCFLESLIARRLGTPDATFADLAARVETDPKFRHLSVVGTDVTAKRSVTFQATTHPDLPLAEAVRISMSIPFFFAARELESDIGTSVYVDGGVLRNYPLSVFDQGGQANPETLGFHLGASPTQHRELTNIVQFTEQLFKSLVDVQLDGLCKAPRDVERTVFIDGSAIQPTEFQIAEGERCFLMEAGAQATVEYLTQSEVATECPVWLLGYLEELGLR